MANVYDVARYVLRLAGEEDALPLTTWKLQKLVYYSQAWSLVWDDAPLFDERIEAWANGPVCPELYEVHRGQFKISDISRGDLRMLTRVQRDTIKTVYKHYGKKSAQYLSELTHQERPWIEARAGLNPGDRGNHVIAIASMAEYYGGL